MTTPDPSMGETGHDTTMLFVTVESKGGPHRDQDYAAGWEMGSLHTLLSLEREHPYTHEQLIHKANQPQAELIAMHNGYAVEFSSPAPAGWSQAPGWLHATFTRNTTA